MIIVYLKNVIDIMKISAFTQTHTYVQENRTRKTHKHILIHIHIHRALIIRFNTFEAYLFKNKFLSLFHTSLAFFKVERKDEHIDHSIIV